MHVWPLSKSRPLISVIRLCGPVAASSRGGALSDDGIARQIERAFRRGRPKAVALVLNSPGGSPVQSALIAARIRRLAEETNIPVHAFVEDVAASGGYWIATAADHIWLDDNSIVGSIGVVSTSFGFHEFIARHGVERRLYTAGASKSLLDPFQPEKPEDVARLRELQSDIHQNFIRQVRARRGARLDDNAALFDGDIWVGGRAVNVGLADGLAHLAPKMKTLYGEKIRFAVYAPKRSLFQRLGRQVVGGIVSGLEERAHWARFGL